MAFYTVTADVASFALSGGVAHGVVTQPAAAGSFTLAGQAAGFVRATRLTAGLGVFDADGQAVEFAQTGSRTMTADRGRFKVNGPAGTLLRRETASVAAVGYDRYVFREDGTLVIDRVTEAV